MRGSNLIQFLRTIDLLGRPQGATLDELKEVLGRDRKSVYRMLSVIKEMHFPVYEDSDPADGRKKRLRLVEEYRKKLPNMKVPEINFSLSELIALYLLRGEEKLYKGTGV